METLELGPWDLWYLYTCKILEWQSAQLIIMAVKGKNNFKTASINKLVAAS